MIRIYDRNYGRLGLIDNANNNGFVAISAMLGTTIETGIYDLELTVPDNDNIADYLVEGNYVEVFTREGKQLLLAIVSSRQSRGEKYVYCEDSTVKAMNMFLPAVEEPDAPEDVIYYLKSILDRTQIQIDVDKSISDKTLQLEFSEGQRIIERVGEVCKAFGLEPEYHVDFKSGEVPKRSITLAPKRGEGGDEKFRISSDELIYGMEVERSTLDLATKLIVRGKSIQLGSEEGEGSESSSSSVNTKQPTANRYDSSKSSGATIVRTTGWSESWVNRFRMDSADPPYVTGDYIDKFLRTYYSDSPLIGHGKDIKEISDYFGISVGAFLGVIAHETVFGRGSCGGRYNFGCIVWTSNSPFNKKWARDRYWIDPPNIRSGISAWFKLLRYNYIETGQKQYGDFLNKYAPAWDSNDHAEIKSLFWGVIKSFGYDVENTVVKKNYSKSTDNPLHLVTTSESGGKETESHSGEDPVVEAIIKEAFRIRAHRWPYTWGGMSDGGYDCSGFTWKCYKTAGLPVTRTTTQAMWNQVYPYKRISRSELKRGDLIMYDTGYTYPGDANHVGIYLGPTLSSPNSVIHSGNPNGITQRADSMRIVGYLTARR